MFDDKKNVRQTGQLQQLSLFRVDLSGIFFREIFLDADVSLSQLRCMYGFQATSIVKLRTSARNVLFENSGLIGFVSQISYSKIS